MKKRSSSREIRRRVATAAARLLRRTPKPELSSEGEKPAIEETSPENEALSFQDGAATSRRAKRYQPHRAKGAKFVDTRHVGYAVTNQGELRAINKPRSRVKRLRAAHNAKPKHKETDQENKTGSA